MTLSMVTILQIGCGVAGYRLAEMLGAAVRHGSPSPFRWILVDPDTVETKNAIGTPGFAGQEGRPKVDVLADRIMTWCGLEVSRVHGKLEDRHWLAAVPGEGSTLLVAAGLDCWEARLNLAECLRVHAPWAILFSTGLDRGRASVSVHPNAWTDSCPACGLRSLPPAASCIAFTPAGELVRGTLEEESGAAARFVVNGIQEILHGGTSLLNTHSCLTLNGSAIDLQTFRLDGIRTCFGPHQPRIALQSRLQDRR